MRRKTTVPFLFTHGNFSLKLSVNCLPFRRSHGNTLELTEESLDYNLTGNHLRLRFSGAHVLSGVNVHEAHGCVVILVATTASVHRLIFPHPNKLDKHVSFWLLYCTSVVARWPNFEVGGWV